MAKPIIELTKKQIKEVEKLSSTLTQVQIADHFGFSDDTFQRICKRDDAVMRAYKKGKATAIAGVGSNLLDQAKDGNVTAQIFYLKTQAGWKEAKDEEPQDGINELAKAMLQMADRLPN